MNPALKPLSFDPDDVDELAEGMSADLAGGIGVYAEFSKIQTDVEAIRRFRLLKPQRQRDHIAEFRRGRQFSKKYGGR